PGGDPALVRVGRPCGGGDVDAARGPRRGDRGEQLLDHADLPSEGPTVPVRARVSALPTIGTRRGARPWRVRAGEGRAGRAAGGEGSAVAGEAPRVPGQGGEPRDRPEVLLAVAALQHLLAEQLVEGQPGGEYRDLPV